MKPRGYLPGIRVFGAAFAAAVMFGCPLSDAQTRATSQTLQMGRGSVAAPPVTVTTLASFNITDGEQPFMENLVQGKDGNLYGMTTYGGGSNLGVVFKVTTAGVITALHSFTGPDGQNPESGLVLGIDGNFYGTVYEGASSGYGTVFKMTPAGVLTTLHTFGNTDGSFSAGALAQGRDKNFYGTTSSSSPVADGTVFKITPAGVLSSLHSFDSTDGADPLAGMVQGTDGNFYGTTAGGGTLGGFGTVFKMTAAGVLASLHSFDNTDGWEPESQLIQAADGNFYGTTLRGGANADGEVFKITAAGKLTVVHSFDVTDGNEPVAGLVQGTDGNFYGTTYAGGTGEVGTVFQMTPAGGVTTLYNFTGISDGSHPYGGIVQHTNGSFYGVTSSGGTGKVGTVFSFSEGLGPFVKLVPASGAPGATITILGSNLTGITSVTFNGMTAAFKPGSKTFLTATVPAKATTGVVKVVTSSGTLKSNVNFRVMP